MARYHKWKKNHTHAEIRLIRLRQYLKRTYGLTLNDYQETYKTQNGLCAICHTYYKSVIEFPDTPLKETLIVDHDHTKTKKSAFRGLLCGNCNHVIGFACDNPKILSSAARYLRMKGK